MKYGIGSNYLLPCTEERGQGEGRDDRKIRFRPQSPLTPALSPEYGGEGVGRSARALIACLLLLLLIGCNDAPPGNLPTARVQIGQKSFLLEIAADPDSRQTGLMHRKSMPDDHGMIFIFPREQEMHFWMENTLIPLDILFLDTAGEIVATATMQPTTGTADTSRLTKYAIELNKGMTTKAAVKKGDVIRLPAEIKSLRVTQ